jgi:hypothetical protein
VGGALGEGGVAWGVGFGSGRSHLWRDWNGLKNKQRIALLGEMQKVRGCVSSSLVMLLFGVAADIISSCWVACRASGAPVRRAVGEGGVAWGVGFSGVHGHLWRDWNGLKTKQRIALLGEMQKVGGCVWLLVCSWCK